VTSPWWFEPKSRHEPQYLLYPLIHAGMTGRDRPGRASLHCNLMESADFVPNPMLGAALATGAMLLFAICSLIIASAMRRLDTDTGALIGALVNLPLGIVLVLAQLALFGAMQPPSLAGVLGFLLAGVFSTFLGRWLFYKSIETAGPARAAGFQTSSPLITALLAWIFLGQYLSPLALTGIALGVVGLATTGLGRQRASLAGAPQHTPIDMRSFVLIGLGSSTAYAVSSILRAGAVQSWNEPIAGVALGAAAGTLVMAFVNRRNLSELRRHTAAQPRETAMYAVVGGLQLVAQTLVIASLAHVPASISALITMCTPLVVLPVSLLVFKNREGIGPFVVLGMFITMAGLALTMLQPR